MSQTAIRRLLAAALALASMILASPGPAAAAYRVTACNSAPGGANNSWSVVRTATATTDIVTAFTRCPTTAADPYGDMQQGIGVFDTLYPGAGLVVPSDRRYAERRVTAPAGTRITGADIVRDLGARSDDWRNYGRIDGVDVPGEQCFRVSPHAFCRVQGFKPYSGLNAQTIAYGMRCGSQWADCTNGSTLHMAWAMISSATVTLDDTVAPAVGSPATSGLADGAWHRGSGQVTFTASDNTGIRVRRLVEGGTVRATAVAPGADADGCGDLNAGLAYTFPKPCAEDRGLNGLRAVEVADVCDWGDGEHSIAAQAEDTDANAATSSGTVTVRVDCTAPHVEVGPGGDRNASEGTAVAPEVEAEDAGAGVAGTEVQVQVGLEGAWTSYTGPVAAQAGHSYRFRARATDHAGNVAGWATSAWTTACRAGSEAPAPLPSQNVPAGTPPAPAPAPVVPLLPVAPVLPRAVPPAPVPAPATVKLGRVRVGRGKVSISGTASGTVTVRVRYRRRGAPKSRAVTRRVRVRRGRFAVTVTVPRRLAGKVRVTASVGAARATASAR